jgi:hypothetical protein
MTSTFARVSTVTFGQAQLRTATSRSRKASSTSAHRSATMSNNVEAALTSIRKPRFVLVSDLDHTMVSPVSAVVEASGQIPAAAAGALV